MIGRAPLDPPRRLPEQRQRAVGAAEQLVEPGQRFAGLEARLHRAALLGEASLLAFLRSEAGDLLGGMCEPFAVAGGGGGLGLLARQFGFDLSDRRPGVGNGASVELAERIEQGAMAFGVEQAAVIVLAVDLDREAADFAEQAGGDGGGANERAAAAVALQRPADDQRLAGLGLDPLLGEQG